MEVREGMSSVVLTVGPDHTLREAARQMASRGVGAAVVIDPEEQGPGIVTARGGVAAAVVIGPEERGPGIVTERHILDSGGPGQSPDTEKVCDHLSQHL